MLKQIKGKLNQDRKKKEILINIEPLETRVVVLDEGKLDNFHIEREDDNRIVGSIFKGKIQNLEDGLQAAFVDIGMQKNAFIHYWDMIPEDAVRLSQQEGGGARNAGRRRKFAPGEMSKKFPIGSEIIVQVTKDAIGTKGPRVSANLSVPGRYLVMMPGMGLKGISKKIEDVKERNRLKKILARLPIPENVGIIVRTAGSGTRKTSFARDARTLLEIWKDIDDGIQNKPAPCSLYTEPKLAERVVRDYLTEDIDRVYLDNKETYEMVREMISKYTRRSRNWVQFYGGEEPIFDYFDVEKSIESIFRRKVWLKSGAYLIFDETEALVAVDVNTGRHKGGKNAEESILSVNLEAADEVARQMRLRNIGGLLVIDFIDMKTKRDQNAVYRTLREALRKDKARTNVLPISQLGLLEMTRQRYEESVYTSTYVECDYCNGRGRVKSSLTMSVELQRRLSAALRKNRGAHSMKVTVNPTVLDRLRREDEQALIDTEKKFSGHLTFVADAHYHMEEFSIINEENGHIVYSSVENEKSDK
ncbi:MAG: Rne/Rng family ribonuclease [Verrucomicrobia bacterium]|nr:Rne/Rng family ribonuclease [Verrucomicrobiota bacterium]